MIPLTSASICADDSADISPHLSSPVGEELVTIEYLNISNLSTNWSILHLPYGGEREGADVNSWSNLFLPFGKVRMGYPTGENERGLMLSCRATMSPPFGRARVGCPAIITLSPFPYI